MAKLRMRSRHPDNKNNKITIVHSIKGKKLHARLKLITISLLLSVVLNAYLSYLIKH